MAKCDECGKFGRSGNNVSHSKRRTKTRFMPNIQSAKFVVNGSVSRRSVCTRCLRTHYKTPKLG